jgi:hypothetical protein
MHGFMLAGEATAAGAGGLVYIRVEAEGAIDAAKPVKEGLSDGQRAALLQACGAQEVGISLSLSLSLSLCVCVCVSLCLPLSPLSPFPPSVCVCVGGGGGSGACGRACVCPWLHVSKRVHGGIRPCVHVCGPPSCAHFTGLGEAPLCQTQGLLSR